MKRDPHDIRKADIEDAAIDGEHVPRISVPLYLCPACGKPLAQAFNWPDVVRAYCPRKKCRNTVTATGKTFDEAVARLREKAGEK